MCLLYADVEKVTDTKDMVTGGPGRNCDFVIYFGVFGLILYPFLSLLYNGYATFRSFRIKDYGYVLSFYLIMRVKFKQTDSK